MKKEGRTRRFNGWGKRERYSSLVIFVLGILVFGITYFMDWAKPELPKELNIIYKQKIQQDELIGATKGIAENFVRIDVNVASLPDLVERGMDEKMAKRFIKYRDLSGGFKNKSQVLKVYGLTDSLVNSLALSYPEVDLTSSEGEGDSKDRSYPEENEKQPRSMKTNTPYEKIVLEINKTQADEITALGVPIWLAQNLINNRKRLGYFKNKPDVLTTYGIDSALFFNKFDLTYDTMVLDKIAVVKIKEPFDSVQVMDNTEYITSPEKVDINTADSITLVSIRGIGAKTARSLLDKRKKLGGFTSIEQVLTLRLHPMVKETIQSKLAVIGPVTPLNVTLMTAEQLANHPYISMRQAEYLKNNSHLYGKGNRPSRHKAYFTKDEWEQLLAYLKF